MILSFRHKGLRELYEMSRTRLIDARQHSIILEIFDVLDHIASPKDLMGYRKFHALQGDRKGRFSIRVTGNYRITFRMDDDEVTEVAYIEDVDYEDYH